MKEYIVRNELITITDIREDGTEYTYIPYSVIEDAETVTKADIGREFGEKVKQMMKMPEYGFCDIERIMEIALEEMEQDESEIERTLKSFNDCEQSYFQSAT